MSSESIRKLFSNAFSRSYNKHNVPSVIYDLKNIHDDVRQYSQVPEYFYTEHFLAQHDRADWFGAHPQIIEFTKAYYKRCQRLRIPMYAHTVYRTPAEQRALQRSGNSKLREGPHNRSCAVDIVHGEFHWNMSDNAWEYLGTIGKEIIRNKGLDMIWGGDWDDDGISVLKDPNERFWDPAHWQMRQWRNEPPVHVVHTPVRRTPLSSKVT